MTEDVIMDRIYKYFNTEARDDIDLEEWIKGFNVILKGENLKSINIDGCTDTDIEIYWINLNETLEICKINIKGNGWIWLLI